MKMTQITRIRHCGMVLQYSLKKEIAIVTNPRHPKNRNKHYVHKKF
jgi:hypothetical protein